MLRRTAQELYSITRPVYSEDSFDEEHKKIQRHHKTFLDHTKAYFTWDSHRLKKTTISLFPIIQWMRIYDIKQWLLSDIVSGFSTGLVAILQGIAYCLLASLPPWYGLYSAFYPILIYFFMGTSRHISVGAFPVLCLMVGSANVRLVPESGPPMNISGFEGLTMYEQRVMVASSLTFLVGIIQLAIGLINGGFIVSYMSDTMISGYTTAASVHILVSQLKFLLGLEVPAFSGPLSVIYTLQELFINIHKTNIASLIITIVMLLVLVIVKELNEKFRAKLPIPIPIEIMMTIIACGTSYAGKFEQKYNVSVVGEIPPGFEAPMAPNVEIFQETVGDAFPIAIVAFTVAYAAGKIYADKYEYTIDGTQELIAFGVCNIFGAFFKCFAVSTALSRTAVQETTGGKTQLAGLISALLVMIFTLSIGFLLEPLPKAVLGSVVVVNLKGMLIQFRVLPSLWKNDRPDFMVWILSFCGALLLGLDLGIVVGLGSEFLSVIFRTQFPRCSLLANIRGTDIYRDRKDYTNMLEPEGVKIFRIPSPIYFANMDFIKNKLTEYLGFNPIRVLRKRNKAIRKIKKLLKKGELQLTEKGQLHISSTATEEAHEEVSIEELEQPVDFKDLPIQINWNAELPANIHVPEVDVHSLILDFAAVSFLDSSAVKGLKTTLKELVRVEVNTYIVGCDMYILRKLHNASFFDEEIQPSIFFLTLHDAILHIMEKHPVRPDQKYMSKKGLSPETKF